MDINKLNKSSKNILGKTEQSSKGKKGSGPSSGSTSGKTTGDKVSITDYQFRNNDQLFAKLELGKLQQSSTSQLGDIKAKITEYQQAKESPDKSVEDTEIGQKINDSSVWQDIAGKILK